MPTAKAPVTPDLLMWAREIAGYPAEEAARRLQVAEERIVAWETGESQPTIAQLLNIAALYQRTPAFFFLAAPPERDLPALPDFRSAGHADIGPALRRELRRAMDRRGIYVSLQGAPEPRFAEIQTPADIPVAELAGAVRSALGFTVEAQLEARDATEALNLWIAAVQDLGLLVFQMSRIDLSEVRGVSIFEEIAPVVILNGGDPPEARSFTLLHELCHVLERSGGLCSVWTDQTIERRCNAFAAETLMPSSEFLSELGDEPARDAVPRLAGRFRVSRDAAAVRLRELGRLTSAEVDEIRTETAARVEERRERDRETPGGPPHYRTHLRNLGPRYVSAVLDALDTQQISLTDAAHYLDARVSTIDRMESELENRPPR